MEQEETVYFPFYPWLQYSTTEQGVYYFNEETGETTLQSPLDSLLLPIGWKVAQANGHVS
jgi:hypothetical protein